MKNKEIASTTETGTVRKEQSNSDVSKKLSMSIAAIIILSLCLSITTFALIYSIVSVEDNYFQTGVVKINLNDGKPVIRDGEILFEPGMTVKKSFFLESESSCDIYYRLYFQNVEGGLADILEIQIRDGDKILYEGTPQELNRENVLVADDILRIRERRELEIYFHFPEEEGNSAQDQYLMFEMAADAVQLRNNVNKEFE